MASASRTSSMRPCGPTESPVRSSSRSGCPKRHAVHTGGVRLVGDLDRHGASVTSVWPGCSHPVLDLPLRRAVGEARRGRRGRSACPPIVTNPDLPCCTLTVVVHGLMPTLTFGHPPIERPTGHRWSAPAAPATKTKSSGAIRSHAAELVLAADVGVEGHPEPHVRPAPARCGRPAAAADVPAPRGRGRPRRARRCRVSVSSTRLPGVVADHDAVAVARSAAANCPVGSRRP